MEGLRFDLADAFARQAEAAADLVQGLRVVVAVQSVAELEHVLLAFREPLDGAPQGLLRQADLDLLLDVLSVGGDQVSERRVAVAAERAVEARAAGAYGVAAIRALWLAPDPAAATLAMLSPWMGDS